MSKTTVLLKPVLTEKATQLAAKNVYMFEVAQNSGKASIKIALEAMYPVKVSDVRITTRKGKMRRTGRRMVYKELPSRKIAYVSVKEGKLELFPQA